MTLDVAWRSAPSLRSAGASPLRCLLLVFDPFSSTAPLARGLCSQDALTQCGPWLGSRLNPKRRELSSRDGSSGFRTGKRQRITQDVIMDFVVLTPVATGAIVCQCRRSGENTGRFEDGDMGSFTKLSLNGKGDKKRSGNGSRWLGMDSDVPDSLPSRHWNGPGDGLRCGFSHDHADSAKDRGWASSSSWSKESAFSSCSTANFTSAGDDRNVSRSAFDSADELLLRHKASTAGIPMSLRMLKRRQVQNRALRKGLLQEANDDTFQSHGFLAMAGESTDCPFKKAFSSMVFMIRTLQSFTIHLRKGAFCEDFQEVLAVMHRELHSSFLWLFQQVFACTPKLMLAVMLLLANFTVYSMGNHVALGAASSPPPFELTSFGKCLGGSLPTDAMAHSQMVRKNLSGAVSLPLDARDNENRDSWLSTLTEFSGDGGASGPIVTISGSPDRARRESGEHASRNEAIFTYQEVNQSTAEAHVQGGSDDGDLVCFEPKVLAPSEPFFLNHVLKKRMVAPVRTKLAPDNYSCYDRTELIYQYGIWSDSTNALLLANYAQFLFLVRRDHDRAEQLFCRAVKADPTDRDIISRFASFLWLARGDQLAAEKAYRAVVDMDPSNPYFTGCLANFMWHSGERASCNITPPSDRSEGATDKELS